MNFNIQKAKTSQVKNIKCLLAEHNLPIEDVDAGKIKLFVVTHKQRIIGVVGVEEYQNIALLRSLAVDSKFRNHDLGKKLVNSIILYCKSNQIEALFLLTTTAERFFEKLGFEIIERAYVPQKIMQTKEFETLCPNTAIAMFKKLN
ncbi:arsenic resistance N-acetyltransferase ArsN2 [Flavobacterium sp. CYK-55]|uniref:arsenic resistance N-acetyltransferase ArsN2 n=1 Tax=Flavobacterium sp. CYK-55 TaxID=2835529 RepID=UPI0020C0B499|nr:arsenic resistance N-acetyltransferase ArsN2 [Flavobacterium sp. CYK-55]